MTSQGMPSSGFKFSDDVYASLMPIQLFSSSQGTETAITLDGELGTVAISTLST